MILGKIVDTLEQYLSKISIIRDYLKIINSPQLVSLSIFKDLLSIEGEKLWNNKYSLYVVNNHHLETLWLPKQKVSLMKGHVFFHLNPQLCYEKITNLQNSIKNGEIISYLDASPNTNGERAICKY